MASQADRTRDIPSQWKQCKSGKFFTRSLAPLDISSLYHNAHCFVTLCGPSLSKVDLSVLQRRRGLLTCGINNSPVIYRPNLWVFGDPPWNFHDAIWKDPAILKFVPLSFIESSPLREKTPHGFAWMPGEGGHCYPRDMPGVIGYRRSGRLDVETFLEEDSISFGRNERHAAEERTYHLSNTLFSVIKILYSIGVRNVYLLGCDFRMSEDRPYAFGQMKSGGEVRSNNKAYERMNEWFVAARPKFEASGLQIVNCTDGSGLTAFENMRYLDAITRATSGVPQDPLDGSGWYGSL